MRTYLRAGVMLSPSIFFWLFASVFLVPKLEQIWLEAGLSGSRVQWLMDASNFPRQYFYYIVPGGVLALLLVESYWTAWPRYRRVVVACVTLFFHTAVLIGITTIATSALVAAPLLHKHN